MGTFGGFAQFSRGALFVGGVGDIYGGIACLSSLAIGVFIAFYAGLWMASRHALCSECLCAAFGTM